MLKVLAYLGGGVLAVAATATVGLMVTIRTGFKPGLDLVRRFNKNFTNRQVMKSAGEAGSSASIVRHVGRSSGRPYETPVAVFEVGDDYYITLPYGTGADWVKNVLAAGRAELVHKGDTVPVDRPEVISSESVVDQLPSSETRTQRFYGVDTMLRFRLAA